MGPKQSKVREAHKILSFELIRLLPKKIIFDNKLTYRARAS
jgi:hypothetical protein